MLVMSYFDLHLVKGLVNRLVMLLFALWNHRLWDMLFEVPKK